MTLALALGLLLTGAGGGLVAGLFGMGVGVVLVPVLAGLLPLPGVDPALRVKMAVGTSLAMTVLTSWLTARRNARLGSMDAALLRGLAPGVLVGVLVGVTLTSWVSGAALSLVFGVAALAVAALVAWPPRPLTPPEPLRQSLAALVGGVSAMMGVGGGTLGVPFLVALGVPVRTAVGTAGALGVLIALPAALGMVAAGWGVAGRGEWAVGYVSLLGATLMLPPALLATPVGVWLAHRLPPWVLRLAFAGLMVTLGLRMLGVF